MRKSLRSLDRAIHASEHYRDSTPSGDLAFLHGTDTTVEKPRSLLSANLAWGWACLTILIGYTFAIRAIFLHAF